MEIDGYIGDGKWKLRSWVDDHGNHRMEVVWGGDLGTGDITPTVETAVFELIAFGEGTTASDEEPPDWEKTDQQEDK